MWYVEVLAKTYNGGDRAFYDAITDECCPIVSRPKNR